MADDLPPDFVSPSQKALAAIPDADEYVSVAYLAASLKPAAEQFASAIAALEAYPIASASPAERADLLELRAVLDRLDTAVRVRIGAIDLAFKRGMEELTARELPVEGWGPVRYTPDEGEWVTHPDQLLAEFRDLKKFGLITDEDIDRAFTVVTTTKVDNRVLNGLRKRGDAVVAAIERNRTRREGRPLAGKLQLPKPKRSEED